MIKYSVVLLIAASIADAGVLDGILGSNSSPTINTKTITSGLMKGKMPSIDPKQLIGTISKSAGSNLIQGAAGLVPNEVMEMCYDYKPKVSIAKPNDVCSFIKGGVDPCAAAPDLTAYGYTKKKSDPFFTKELDNLRTYCQSVAKDTATAASLPQAISGYSASGNIRSSDPKNASAVYGSSGVLGWDNIKAYSTGGKTLTNNYYLYKAVSNNDWMSFKYYQDVLENSVGNGATVKNKVNVFSPNELKKVTVPYNNIQDYNNDVKKIATVLRTSTQQSSAVRVANVSQTEMAKAELNAQASGADAEVTKESIAGSKTEEIEKAIDNDVDFKTRFYGDLTTNPNNRIVYPAKGYVDTLPPDKKIVAVKKIELQAKRDAMLRASFEEIGEMRKEVAKLVMENAKISARQFNASAAAAEINALIK